MNDTVEVAEMIYEKFGLTIMDTSMGLVVEFSDDDIQHGFTIAHEKLADPACWAEASAALNTWMGIPDGDFTVVD